MAYVAKVFSAQHTGLSAAVIEVEADITKNTLFAFSVVGLADKAVEESRDRVSAALKNQGFPSPKQQNQKTVVSLAPAHMKKEGALFDLSIALAFLLAEGHIAFDPTGKLFIGELSLEGRMRPVKGVLIIVEEAKRRGFSEIYVPKENEAEAALVGGITIFGVSSLKELAAHVHAKPTGKGMDDIQKISPAPRTEIIAKEPRVALDFSDIRGQETAKRGMEIAAAGGHNIGLHGPPGTGKTMLARALVGILPPLSFDESLEVTGIHSVAGILEDTLVGHPPFRAPHHTASYTAVVGGGAVPKPGEITLAHRGVLFLDEFPEFEKRVIESLREPLEEHVINISRAKGSETFPAHIILVAAMNPCPCGNRGGKDPCTCTPALLQKYERKLSGPILDRIDLWVSVGSVAHRDLTGEKKSGEESRAIKSRVLEARKRQRERLAHLSRGITTNSEMSARELSSLVPLAKSVEDCLVSSAERLRLSVRSYHKTLKLARTIADLAGDEHVEEPHILEALSYRPRMRE